MMISVEGLRVHIGYTAWASGRLVEAAGGLTQEELTRDFGTADKSVLGTLVHVFGADRLWLARLKGEPATTFLTDADHRLTVLQHDWPALYGRWKAWASGLTDESANAELSYADMSGNPFRQQIGLLVLHVVNHGTHHRGAGIRISARHGTCATQAGSVFLLSRVGAGLKPRAGLSPPSRL